MPLFGRKKKADQDATSGIKSGQQLDQQIQRLMEQLNIPLPARQGILKLPDAQKRAMVKQYEEQLKDEQREESGKEWSNKLNVMLNTDTVDGKLLKTLQIVFNASNEKFSKEFIEEMGLKRLSRIRGNGDHDLQILMIYKAIMDTDTSNKIKRDMIDNNQCINNIVAKVDSDDGKVREQAIKLLVLFVCIDDNELSERASVKVMSHLLEIARKQGYRNRWRPVIAHLSVNEGTETGTLDFDFHALLMINFIINGLESVDQRTDERRLLAALKFDESVKALQKKVEEEMMSLHIGADSGGGSGHQRRQSTLRTLQKERLHKHEVCGAIGAQLKAFTKFRSEDIAELKESGVIDDHNDLSSPDGLFRKLQSQALTDGYINELTAILKHLITIPVSGGDMLWSNITEIVAKAVAPTQDKYRAKGGADYLTMSELQNILNVKKQEAEQEKEREQKESALEQQLQAEQQKLGAERSKVAELEKQVQELQGQIDDLQSSEGHLAGGLPQFGGGGLGGLPPPDYGDSPQITAGGGLPKFGGIPQFGLGGLPPPDYPDSPSKDDIQVPSLQAAVPGLPTPAPIPPVSSTVSAPIPVSAASIPAPIPGLAMTMAPIPSSAAPIPQPVSAAVPMDDGLNKFRKMIKMKVPKPAVINKMKQSGIDSSIIMKYELSGNLPDPPSGGSAVPIPSAAAVPVDDGLDKFRKMIKMSVPKPAVINKMKQSGVEGSIIMKYELSGKLPDPPSSGGGGGGGGGGGAGAPIPTAAPAKAPGLTPEEITKTAKYTKMKKMKLPEQAIRNKMKQDGIPQTLVDKFFGTSSGSSTSAVTKKKAKPKPKWPDGLKKKPEIKPGRKMKNLQWSKVNPFDVEKSIWKECDDTKIDFDRAALEEMFGQKVIAKKAKSGGGGGKKKKAAVEQIHVLEGKRSYNIEIFLGRLRMDRHDVKKALLDLDEKTFNAEQVGKLKNFVPTPEEVSMLDGVDPDDEPNLAKPEKFFFTIKSIDKNIPQRLELWAFKMNFDKVLDVEREKVNALQEAHRCINDSKSLRIIFSTILAFGNHMNGGSRKGQAHGFKLSSLSQLTRSRSTDNKVTLMEYLYLYLEQKQPNVLQFSEEWKPLNEAVSVDIPTLRSGVAQIGSKLNLIKRRVDAASGAIAGDQFGSVMRPFHGSASKQFTELKDDHEKVMKDLTVLAGFLGETKDSTAAFLKTLNEFRKQFMMTAKQCAAKRKKEEERKKREQWKAQRAGKHKAQKSGDKLKSRLSGTNIGLPPPIPEMPPSDDSKEEHEQALSASNAMKGGGLPPPPKSDQMLASLMRNDSEALMNKLRNRRKKSNKRPSQH